PADLLAAERVERALDLVVQREEIGDAADPVLRQPATELAVVTHQLLGLSPDVDRHTPPATELTTRRRRGLHPLPPVKQQETTPPMPAGPGLDLVRLSQFLELAGELLLAGRDGVSVARRIVEGAALVLRVPGVALGALDA